MAKVKDSTDFSPRKPAYVYVIGHDGGPHKIGVAGNVSQRLADIQTHYPHKLSVHFSKLFCRVDAFAVESACHKFLADKNTNGEWFDIDAATARASIDRCWAAIRRGDMEWINPQNRGHGMDGLKRLFQQGKISERQFHAGLFYRELHDTGHGGEISDRRMGFDGVGQLERAHRKRRLSYLMTRIEGECGFVPLLTLHSVASLGRLLSKGVQKGERTIGGLRDGLDIVADYAAATTS